MNNSHNFLTSILNEHKYFDRIVYEGKAEDFADDIIYELYNAGYRIVEK